MCLFVAWHGETAPLPKLPQSVKWHVSHVVPPTPAKVPTKTSKVGAVFLQRASETIRETNDKETGCSPKTLRWFGSFCFLTKLPKKKSWGDSCFRKMLVKEYLVGFYFACLWLGGGDSPQKSWKNEWMADLKMEEIIRNLELMVSRSKYQ